MPELNMNDERMRARELLPWLAKGCLNDVDSLWLNDWLSAHPDDAQIHSELAWLKKTARHYQSSVVVPDSEKGLDTLLARIHSEKNNAAEQRRQSVNAEKPTAWLRLKSWLTTPAFGLSMAALLLIQTGVIGLLMKNTPVPSTSNAPVSTQSTQSQTLNPLSGGQISIPADAALLQVTFMPNITERDMRTALLNTGAQIVAGPSALGVYMLAVPAKDTEKSLQFLLSQKQVIESAERP